MSSRNVTADEYVPAERYAIYRLCECSSCEGTGKTYDHRADSARCQNCRGEGRTRELIATCGTPEAIGVALVTLGREGEWKDCPIGLLDTMGETGEKWLVRPWQASTRNVTDAAKLLRSRQTQEKKT